MDKWVSHQFSLELSFFDEGVAGRFELLRDAVLLQKEEPHDGQIESVFHSLRICIPLWNTGDRKAIEDHTIGVLAIETRVCVCAGDNRKYAYPLSSPFTSIASPRATSHIHHAPRISKQCPVQR